MNSEKKLGVNRFVRDHESEFESVRQISDVFAVSSKAQDKIVKHCGHMMKYRKPPNNSISELTIDAVVEVVDAYTQEILDDDVNNFSQELTIVTDFVAAWYDDFLKRLTLVVPDIDGIADSIDRDALTDEICTVLLNEDEPIRSEAVADVYEYYLKRLINTAIRYAPLGSSNEQFLDDYDSYTETKTQKVGKKALQLSEVSLRIVANTSLGKWFGRKKSD